MRNKLRKKYDILIVGAGLFGASFAAKAIKHHKKVLVIDKVNEIGGACATELYNTIIVHKYGPHIFHTNNNSVFNFLSQYTDMNPIINSPIAFYKGETYNLPFNMNTFSQMFHTPNPQDAKSEIEKDSIKITNPQNLEEYALSHLGKTIYEKLIKGYTEKQWGRPCTELPTSIIERLPIRFEYNNNYFSDTHQAIPSYGYTKMCEEMLKGADLLLGMDYKHFINQYPKIKFKKIIYTGPIDEFFDYSLGELEYRSLKFETYKLDRENFQGTAVMNYTDKDVEWTRVIEHKFLSRFGKATDQTILTYEYPLKYSVNGEILGSGRARYYPINDEKNDQLYTEYKKLAEQYKGKVYFCGRLGTYKYLNMDQTVDSALKLFKEIYHK